MLARVISNRWLLIENASTPEEDCIERRFSASRPGYRFVDIAQQSWDGVYRKYDRFHKRMSRALLGELRALCDKHELPLAIQDDRPPAEYAPLDIADIKSDFLPGITLDDFQLAAIHKACKVDVGIVDVPTGGGKGELIAGFCKAIPCPTVVIAEQTIVIDQLKERLELRDVAEEIGLFYAGKRPNGEIVIVGTIQSLTIPTNPPKKPERRKSYTDKKWVTVQEKHEISLTGYATRKKNAVALRKMVGKSDMLIVDECDKAVSKPYRGLFLHWFKGRRRYGFSGTPFDDEKPVENLVLHEHLGSVIVRESRERLEQINRIIPLEYFAIAFGNDRDKNTKAAFDIAVDDKIVYNEEFHALIGKLCDGLPDDDGILILVERDDLGYALEALIPNSKFIHGKTAKPKRREVLKEFEDRKLRVLIGGKILKRGLDLSGGCENLILATGGKLRSEFVQQIGRAVRHNKSGKARIFDFYFLCNYYLYKHSRARLKVITDLGYPAWVVYDDGKLDARRLIASRFRRPRDLSKPVAKRKPKRTVQETLFRK